MNKIFLVTLLVAHLLSTALNAQTDSTKVNLGAMMVPMGWVNLDQPNDEGLGSTIGIFGVAQVIRGNTVFTPYYAINTNAYGAAVYQQIMRNFGVYVVGNKSALRNNGYVGIGVGTPLAKGHATGFVEVGSSWKTWGAGLYFGAFIPIVTRVR